MCRHEMVSRPTRLFDSVAGMLLLFFIVGFIPLVAQTGTQKTDEEYTRLIGEYLTDARISTELVDYLPYSDVVPTTLEFPGIERIVGTPDELTYAEDIQRYLKAVAAAAPERARIIPMGLTEEGREMIIIAISNEETIAKLDTYRGYLHELTDPRVTSEERAKELQKIAKPIYWITTGLHSSERGGPEMVMELAYRLVVDESDFIREIRDNVITFITPVLEVDGRERMVDTYLFNKELKEQRGEDKDTTDSGSGRRGSGSTSLPLMYWGKYVQHDNNRDGMGQFLALTRNTTKIALEWKPTVMHDLHEAQTLLYSSTGTGPYNDKIDAITVGEWWLLAQNDVMEMTKQGVPGVWTYNFYDGWTPNYLFYAAHSHNAVGRFYEVASYGPQNRTVSGNQSREWFRPNPLQESIEWGPRANTNIQQSAVLYSLHFTGHERVRFLENYWIKNRNAIERGTEGEISGWVIPAGQHSKADAAMAVNDMIDQGLEFHTADEDFTVGDVEVKKGDYIVRGDQPYRTIADIYFSTQQFPVTNPRPYDDLGWTFHYMRDIETDVVEDQALLSSPMTAVIGHVTAAGGIQGTGMTVVVNHTGDNNMVTLRFQFADLPMAAAEEAFEVEGQHFGAGSFIIPNGNTPEVGEALTQLGLTGRATDDLLGDVPTHDLDVPRIGYIHSWSRTQDEGWVRASLDSYGVPYAYFGENEVHRRNLRDEFDVIIYPAGGRVGKLAGEGDPIPYQRTEKYRSFGTPDATDDVRGQLGEEGLAQLYDFVRAGGTLIAEGGTAAIFPGYDLTPGLSTVQAPSDLIARGSIFRGVFADETSPIRYGIERNQIPVYFSRGPILDAGVDPAAPAPESMRPEVPTRRSRFGGGGTSVYQNTQPMATPVHLASYDPRSNWPEEGSVEQKMADEGGARSGSDASAGRSRFRGFGGGTPEGTLPGMGPRVILQFPPYAEDMLLTGGLENGQALSNRAQLVDQPVGDGHMVLFAIRPFWRWQTQGTYILGFNAIMNWNDLSAGR